MSQLLETTASSEPTPSGTADPVPTELKEPSQAAADEPPPQRADPLEELQKRPHPFAE